jgi:DNA ligase 1
MSLSKQLQENFEEIIINDKSYVFIVENGVYKLPITESPTKQGKTMAHEIYVIDNKIYKTSYLLPNGKKRESAPTICSSKNIGKKNETSPHQQALFEAYSAWKKKQKTDIQPMLANKYDKMGKKYLTEPFGVSEKLDGIRALASFVEDSKENEVKLLSRGVGKAFVFLNKIKGQLTNILPKDNSIILDGELYSHNIPFSEISGIVRATTKKHILDDNVEYYIFDVIPIKFPDMSYKNRMELLKQLQISYNKLYNDETNRRLKFIFYTLATHVQVREFHDKFVSSGFEGLMCRELNSPYEIGFRSNYLLKLKDFQDDEFKITNYTEGNGSETGCIIYTCLDHNTDKTFEVRPRGSIENRKELFKNGSECIGKLLTVRYQKTGIDNNELPRFPVGISIRDYE